MENTANPAKSWKTHGKNIPPFGYSILHVDDKCTLDHDQFSLHFIYSHLLWKPRVISPGNDVLTRQFPRKRAIWSMLKMALFQPCLLAKWRLYWNASANLLKQAGPPKDLPKFLYHWAHKGCTFPSGYPCYPGEKQVGNLDEFSWKKNLETLGCCENSRCRLSLRLPSNTPWSKYLRWDTLGPWSTFYYLKGLDPQGLDPLLT